MAKKSAADKKTKSRPAPLTAREWRVEAIRLHVGGWNYAQIGIQLGKGAKEVREGIAAELSEQTAGYADQIKQLREIKSTQLDAVIRGAMPDAENGLPAAAAIVISAVATQAKLHGLAAAEKVDVNASITLNVDAHTELLNRLAKIAGE